ncbi:MAG TPA: hypothetical protein VJA26_16670 [Gammaproteobacteria bacterium]|nr:hypothetical protein [Gammaproteobacteria bacterium]
MKTLYLLLLLPALAVHTAAAQTDLVGTWQGALQVAPGSTLNIHFVITAQPGGAYGVVVTSPDSGGIKDVPASGVAFADGRLDVEVAALSGGYKGELRDGVIEGEWSQEGTTLPLTLRPYAAPVLSQADIDALLGQWVGKLQIPGLELTMVLRFTADAEGKLTGVFDSPDQNALNIPLTDIVLDDGNFSVKVPALRGEYKGRLTGEEIAGEWGQGGPSLPLSLKKGEYVAATHYLDLPPAARAQVTGRWRGTVGPLTLVVRFEADDQGRLLGFVDSPDQGANGLPITEATLADGKLTFRVASVGAEFSGDVSGARIAGQWTQLGMSNPLTLARE